MAQIEKTQAWPMTGRVLPGNMSRLLLMRAVLIFCQLLLVLISLLYDGIALALPPFMATVTLYILLNVVSLVFLLRSRGLTERVYFGQLIGDVLFLTALLFFSGGYTNPFISLYLLPLIIVSSTLGRLHAWLMAALILACYTLLVFFYRPLFVSAEIAGVASGFHLHLLGMWFSFALSVGLIVFFIMRMTRNIQQRDLRLAEMRETAQRDNHVLALGAMAAGAAHELGTPLSTMAVVTHELECDHHGDKDITGQTAILKDALARCKQVLSQLSFSAGEQRAEGGRRLGFDVYMREVAGQWKMTRPLSALSIHASNTGPAPDLIADVSLTQALCNLLNNAMDACAEEIQLEYGWGEDGLWLEIRDQGEGFPPHVLQQPGLPAVSSKSSGRGLGLFLSRAVIERLGGRLDLYNPVQGGACARVSLPQESTQ